MSVEKTRGAVFLYAKSHCLIRLMRWVSLTQPVGRSPKGLSSNLPSVPEAVAYKGHSGEDASCRFAGLYKKAALMLGFACYCAGFVVLVWLALDPVMEKEDLADPCRNACWSYSRHGFDGQSLRGAGLRSHFA